MEKLQQFLRNHKFNHKKSLPLQVDVAGESILTTPTFCGCDNENEFVIVNLIAKFLFTSYPQLFRCNFFKKNKQISALYIYIYIYSATFLKDIKKK